MDKELQQRFDRLDKKLTTIMQDRKKEPETWVKVSFIVELTGWNREKLRRMRDNNCIKFKKENGIWYLLESLHPMFYKKKTA